MNQLRSGPMLEKNMRPMRGYGLCFPVVVFQLLADFCGMNGFLVLQYFFE